MKQFMRVMALLLLLTAIGLSELGSGARAASAEAVPIVLSLAVPSGMKDLATSQLAKDYEAANPGVKINVVDQLGVPWAADGLSAHFAALQKYANSADVLYLTVSRISPAATRAGYFLDLAPYVNSDKTLNVDDFYAPIWASYQWDNGIWALPSSAQMWVLNYDQAAFDKAGLTYPTDHWTLDDFANAARKLTVRNADNTVITPGFAPSTDYSTLMLFRSLLGNGLFDLNSSPNAPQFSGANVENLLATWFKLTQEGVVGASGSSNAGSLPMTVTFAQAIPTLSSKRAGSLLPGGKSGLDTRSFAVSAGTQYPEQAYALAKWLTTRGDIPYNYGHIPARKSLVNYQPGSSAPIRNLPADIQDLIARGFANPVTVADMRYVDYLRLALNQMKSQNLTANAAEKAAEVQAAADLGAAAASRGKLTLAVLEPAPQSPLAAGKVALTFDVYSLAQPLPNQAAWNTVIQSFVAADPVVGRVNLTSTRAALDQAAAASDCFYLPANAIPGATLTNLLSLDPFLADDRSFDPADVINGLLASVQRDNKTWAMPLVIAPSVLRYDSAALNKVGAPDLATGWSIDAFVSTLKALKANGTGQPPLSTAGADDTPLLILIAAYGGLPLDYRTAPTTINFTDTATVAAIRQVLDLVKAGDIKYVARGSNITPDVGGADQTAPLYPDTLSALGGFVTANPAAGYQTTLYPHGTKFTGIGYTMGAAYISAGAHNPDACYRFIATLARHPELFMAMPARRSLLVDATFKAATNPTLLALYSQIDGALKNPNTVAFPIPNALSTPVSDFLLRYWLYQAFDSYVLKNSDLDGALRDAEGYAQTYQACASNLPSIGIGSLNSRNALLPYVNCAEKADSRLKAILDPLVN